MSKKQAYLDALKSLEIHDDEPAKPVDQVVVEPVKVEKTVEAVAPAVVASDAPTQAVTQVAEPELFPGFNNIQSEETRNAIKERWEAADRLKAEKAEAEQRYRQAQDRVGPTQQQLAKAQTELARVQQQLNEVNATRNTGATNALRQKIAALSEQFPDDAERFNGVLDEVELAKKDAGSVKTEVEKLKQQLYINEQKQELAAAHPDWQKKRAKIAQDEAGNYVVRPAVDTEDAKELAVWANALDPYERNLLWPMFGSSNANDAIYLLNRFERDRLTARALSQTGQHAPPQVTPAPPTKVAPVVDPDPSRRTTAPSSSTAGQPMSEKKREYLAAVAEWNKQKDKPAARRHA